MTTMATAAEPCSVVPTSLLSPEAAIEGTYLLGANARFYPILCPITPILG